MVQNWLGLPLGGYGRIEMANDAPVSGDLSKEMLLPHGDCMNILNECIKNISKKQFPFSFRHLWVCLRDRSDLIFGKLWPCVVMINTTYFGEGLRIMGATSQ